MPKKPVITDTLGRELGLGDYVAAVEPAATKDGNGRRVIGRILSIDEQAIARIVHPHLPGGVLDAFCVPANECRLVLTSDGEDPEAAGVPSEPPAEQPA